jgi:alpha-tubulin suppressor-like RCC1 family protein
LQYAIDTAQAVWDLSYEKLKELKFAPVSLSAGDSHTLAIDGNGAVWAWGLNTNGQLGDSSNTMRNTPVRSGTLSNAVAVSAGWSHSLALLNNGTVWAWGFNSSGQLGIGNTSNRNTPVRVIIPDNVKIVSISAGTIHSLALCEKGTVWAWGALGYSSTPVQVDGLVDVIAIAAGRSHSMVLLGDGTVWTWGFNDEGQLGNGTFVSSSVPVQVQGLNDIVSISAASATLSARHNLALRSDTLVFAWGFNSNRQLGDNTTINRNVPIQVPSVWAAAIDAGGEHSMALRTNTWISAWGANGGRIGNSSSSSPQGVPTLVNRAFNDLFMFEDAAEISAGGAHSVARKIDGTIWAWGTNTNGQLGDGTASVRLAPVRSAQSLANPATLPVTLMRIGEGAAVSDISSAVSGETVNIAAVNNQNNRFVRWQVLRGGITLADPTNPRQSFRMPNNYVRIRAVFEEYSAPTAHRISMLGLFGNVTSDYASAVVGTEVTITAAANTGYRFLMWEVVSGGISIAEPENPFQTFIMPDNPVQIRAVFETVTTPVTHNVNFNVTGSGTVQRSHATATAGTVVTLTANANDGHRFLRWEVQSGGISLSSTTNRIATFTMPNNAVTVRAVFESVHRLGERTFNLSGQMALTNLPSGQSDRSSAVSVNVTSLPTGARISRISVNIGTTSGSIIPSNLIVTCSSRPEQVMQIPWTGQLNTPIGNDRLDFWNYEANAVYEIWWYGTNASLSAQSRSYGNVSLTIEYTYRVD